MRDSTILVSYNVNSLGHLKHKEVLCNNNNINSYGGADASYTILDPNCKDVKKLKTTGTTNRGFFKRFLGVKQCVGNNPNPNYPSYPCYKGCNLKQQCTTFKN